MVAAGRRTPLTHSLRQLARLFGVHTAYDDFFGQRRDASAESVLEGAKLLGASAHRFEDVPEAVRARKVELWNRVLEPVITVWPPAPADFEVRCPVGRFVGRMRCSLRLEDGSERRWTCDLRNPAGQQTRELHGQKYLRTRVPLPRRLPLGYHDLIVELAGEAHRSLVVAAPMRAWSPEGRHWGAFLPLYSMHSKKSWGAGDFSDLHRFRNWIQELGGSVVSILPVLASYLDKPFDPSPYAPASRLFWNEFYVDPRQAPELTECQPAQRLLASPAFQQEVAARRAAAHVDYKREYALRRRVLEELARSLGRARNKRHDEFRRYVAAHPSLQDYAAFRAVLEKRREPWPDWPEPLRSGTLAPGDYDHDSCVYHLYAQWLAEQQLASFSSAARQSRPGLYLDFPLGVHRFGYDPWRHRDVFVSDACGGAPPDEVFTQGQNWAFPPLHPEAIRAQGYRYLIECLRRQLAHATFLRIDHVMSLHRLYWIPKGAPGRDGVYVRYRSDELYAILCLESQRHRSSIVGENLGTVPARVNAALSRHGIQKIYVVQYETRPNPTRPLRPVPAGSVASLNTHDMPPFAAYLRGMDFRDRVQLGLLPRKQLRGERAARRGIRRALAGFFHRRRLMASASEDDAALTRAALAWLAASPAPLLLVNLEDLWLETELQNLPGTGDERPNWRRKARYSLDQLQTDGPVVDTLRLLGGLRAHGKAAR